MNKVILHINSFLCNSTGNIMRSIAFTAESFNIKSIIAYPSSRTNIKIKIDNGIKIGNIIDRNIHLLRAYLSGYNGCYSYLATKKFLKQVDQIKPDIIHLHNLHNCYINLEMLFEYIKNKNIPVIWTLHDCWAFTGQCPHYTIAKCDKWQSGCYDCPQYRQYPKSRVDKTKEMYELKKRWFTGVKNLTIVTPSEWLKSQVNKSFLSEYPVKVINNGIDLSIFKPVKSNFRDRYNINDKIMLLGVANPWSNKKGLHIFIELSKLLNNSYKIVLVGLSNEQISQLPKNILGLSRISDQRELAEIYSAADYFINPSFEETMGLVTVEALACGVPVIVSNYTAVPEVVNESCGIIINESTVTSYFDIIKNLKKEFSSISCIEQARKYDKVVKNREYIDLYEQILINRMKGDRYE